MRTRAHMRTKVIATFAAGVLIAAGCSTDSAESSPDPSSSESATASAQFNDADVMFASMMYPHHAQAVDMAAMVDGRTDNPEVLSLAEEIAAAQQPEMDRMTAWLAEWGKPAPSADMGEMGGMDSGSGMMTPQDMDTLAASSGPYFDRQWLTMMIAHHTGAIEMANIEIADGSNPDAQEMARAIVTSQQQEIETMRRLLG